MDEKSRSVHISALASELLDDIELSRLPAEQLLLKCSRLARWVGSDEIRDWIAMEMAGYINNDLGRSYMTKTGRWVDKDKDQGYWGPLAQQEALISAQNAKLSTLRIPDLATDYALASVSRISSEINQASNIIVQIGGIRSRVLSMLHNFVSDVYYAKQFDLLAESIFEKYRLDVDAMIFERCGSILQKIPSVMDRLAENGEEGVSQALLTCRRIIEDFADAVYPPTNETIELSGNVLKLDATKYQNRLNAYVAQRTNSKSRRTRIRQNLSNLYDRVSTGVHKEVDQEEARSLFLSTYLLIGEILNLKEGR